MQIPPRTEPTLSRLSMSSQAEGFVFSSPVMLREELEAGQNVEINDDAESEEGKERDFLLVCRKCGHPITSRKARIAVAGSHNHTFFNPAGIVYGLACFSTAPGCVLVGARSPEFSWFAGCLWQVAICRGCANHLGWHFLGDEQSFYGLIVAELVSGGF